MEDCPTICVLIPRIGCRFNSNMDDGIVSILSREGICLMCIRLYRSIEGFVSY